MKEKNICVNVKNIICGYLGRTIERVLFCTALCMALMMTSSPAYSMDMRQFETEELTEDVTERAEKLKEKVTEGADAEELTEGLTESETVGSPAEELTESETAEELTEELTEQETAEALTEELTENEAVMQLRDQLQNTGSRLSREAGSVFYTLYAKAVLSDEDYDNMIRIVEAEATGQDLKAKMLVANVVLNRVEDSRFPDTITEVIMDRSADGTVQFTPIADGRFYAVSVTDETKEAVGRALAGEDDSQGAMFFVARSRAGAGGTSWFDTHLKYLFHYAGHSYFTFRDDDPNARGTVSSD